MPADQREVLSVGIDVGTTTTQVVFSHLLLHDVARPGQVPRIQVDEKSVLHKGEVHATPLSAPDLVDAEALAALVRQEYDAAGISPQSIETGAVIITGETARTKNAEAILRALSTGAGDFVVTIAGPNAEAQIAGRGSGAARWSSDHYEQVTSIDIGGGTTNAAVFKMGRHLALPRSPWADGRWRSTTRVRSSGSPLPDGRSSRTWHWACRRGNGPRSSSCARSAS